MRITIDVTPHESDADPDHEVGLIEEAWDELNDVLDSLGYTDIEVKKA